MDSNKNFISVFAGEASSNNITSINKNTFNISYKQNINSNGGNSTNTSKNLLIPDLFLYSKEDLNSQNNKKPKYFEEKMKRNIQNFLTRF